MEINEVQEKFLQQQDELRGRINTEDTFDINSIKLIAGVDLAYWQKNDEEYAVCCIVVVDFKSHKIIPFSVLTARPILLKYSIADFTRSS